MLDQRAADQRPARRADREHQRKDAEGVAAPRFRIKARDQRRGAADDQPGPDPLQKAEEQQRPETRRRRAQQKSRGVPGQPGAEHARMPPDVADPAESEHQPGMGQHIADDDPLDHRDRQAEAAGDVGEGDVDRGVERHHRDAETERDETQQRRRSGGRGRLSLQDHAGARPFFVRAFIGGERGGDKSRKGVPSMNETYALAVHGGAGTIRRGAMSAGLEAEYHAALRRALEAGSAILAAGGAALDAVTARWSRSKTIRCSMPGAARYSRLPARRKWMPP